MKMKGASKYFRFYLNFWRKVMRRGTPLERALRVYLSARQWRELRDRVSDHRLIVHEAARLMEVPEKRLLSALAQDLGTRFVAEVHSVDLRLLPTSVRIADLRRAGCIPYVSGSGKITALIGVDPERVELSLLGDYPVYLGAWADVARAIDSSEQRYMEHSPSEPLPSPSEESVAIHSLRLLFEEAARLGAVRLGVCFESDQITYRFRTASGAAAHGLVHHSLMHALGTYLERVSMQEHTTVRLSATQSMWMIVERGSNEQGARLYDIRWSETLPGDRSPRLYSPPEQRAASQVVQADVLPHLREIAALDKVVPFPDTPISHSNAGNSPARPFSVLLVEDNTVFARVLERFLEKQNIVLQHVTDGAQALDSLGAQHRRPDLVICDVHMPNMNGFEFVKRLRDERKVEELPVLMLTSDDSVETELRLLEDGADSFISKSEDPRLLAVKIRRLLERASKRAAA